MKVYVRSSIELNRDNLKPEQKKDVQVSDMFPSMMLMEGNSHKALNYFEWCLKDAQRIGSNAYVVVDEVDGDDYCCIMRGLSYES